MAEQGNKSDEQGDKIYRQRLKSAEQRLRGSYVEGLRRVAVVVGHGRLDAEADKQGDGFAASEANEQRPVTIDAIVVGEIAAVALHHVDVVHTQLRREAKGRVTAAVAKEFAKGDHHCVLVGFRVFDLSAPQVAQADGLNFGRDRRHRADGETMALFIRFTTQSTTTDDRGDPK